MPLTETLSNGFTFLTDPAGDVVQLRFDPTTAIEMDADDFHKFVLDLQTCAVQLRAYRLSQKSRN